MPRVYLFHPPLKRGSGGLTVLRQVAAGLRAAGADAVLVVRERAREAQADAIPEIPFEQARPGPGDVWIAPEGWPNALAPGLAAKARCHVYCQNWAYLFNGLPEGVSWRSLPVSFLAVSHPTALFIERALGRTPPILRPAIEAELFFPPKAKPRPDPVRIAHMPRKNKALAEQIMAVTAARSPETGLNAQFVEIKNLDRRGVAEVLRSCHVFLATGFPEGCPLPPLEAMACGCLPVGFTGFGGWDYMRQARPEDPGPSFPLRPVPWGGNGFFAADGDVYAACLGLERAMRLWTEGGAPLAATLAAGRETAAQYGLERQRQAIAALLAKLS